MTAFTYRSGTLFVEDLSLQSTVEIAPQAQMTNATGMYRLGRQLAAAKGYGA